MRSHGWSYSAILAHYYTGTTIGTRPALTVRVLLLDGTKRDARARPAPWTVSDAAGTTEALPAGKLALTTALDRERADARLTADLHRRHNAAPGRHDAVPWEARRQIVRLDDPGGELTGARGVRQGCRPAEMPPTGRRRRSRRRRLRLARMPWQPCRRRDREHVRPLRRHAKPGLRRHRRARRRPRTGRRRRPRTRSCSTAARWRRRTSPRAPAAGRPRRRRRSARRSRTWSRFRDPYDTLSPYHDWGPVLFSAAAVGEGDRGSPGTLLNLRPLSIRPTLGPTSSRQSGTNGRTSLTGAGLSRRSRPPLDLVLGRVARDHARRRRSSTEPATTLTGLVRGRRATSRSRNADGRRAGRPSARSHRTRRASSRCGVTPHVTTQYRLTAGTVNAALVTVTVVPVVTRGARHQRRSRHGASSRSGLSRSSCRLQQGTQWTTVATGATDSSGAFLFTTTLNPGSYRVRSAPGGGLSPGVSGHSIVQ